MCAEQSKSTTSCPVTKNSPPLLSMYSKWVCVNFQGSLRHNIYTHYNCCCTCIQKLLLRERRKNQFHLFHNSTFAFFGTLPTQQIMARTMGPESFDVLQRTIREKCSLELPLQQQQQQSCHVFFIQFFRKWKLSTFDKIPKCVRANTLPITRRRGRTRLWFLSLIKSIRKAVTFSIFIFFLLLLLPKEK